ncbi:MAG: hypothetical protein RBS72_21410 [Sedimentisphaerales bacterium]|jgi:hypothetical protein|nr:hypothetical protein [Sedimentisphaerales bacterium]HNY80404.1 hypothetical protein [Sedimentisphaerales bacterium]HOC65265.1 hypothetical protein [Sedimentisphaerales bacterium]HOH66244.1 hypothetical protein [Sedimentisphaerales bacterium]HPY48704.1 hypothetical protein [Sedimentisphaerales bacterium]
MTPKAAILLILSLATTAFSTSAPTEPNETTELSFQMSNETTRWTIEAVVDDTSVYYDDPGSIRPRYAAQLILPRHSWFNSTWVLELAMNSPLAQKLSPAQKEFLAQGFGTRVDKSAANIPNYYSIYLYAVSEEDAKNMARAAMDGLTTLAKKNLATALRGWEKWKQDFEHSRRELVEKQEQLKKVEPQYDNLKMRLHPGLGDDDAEQLARELIFQMNKEGNTLDIELAGIRAKLQIIDDYRSRSDLDKNVSDRLEAMRIDQLIELSSLEARRKAIERILAAEQEFCRLYGEKKELRETIPRHVENIRDGEESLKGEPEILKQRREAHATPRIYNDTVILYPIADSEVKN